MKHIFSFLLLVIIVILLSCGNTHDNETEKIDNSNKYARIMAIIVIAAIILLIAGGLFYLSEKSNRQYHKRWKR